MAITSVAQRRADPLFNTTQAPIDRLYKTIQQKILSYLSYKKDMRSVHLVQQSWSSFMPRIEHLDLSKTRITDVALARILSKFKGNKIRLNSISFSDCQKITRQILSWLSLHPHYESRCITHQHHM